MIEITSMLDSENISIVTVVILKGITRKTSKSCNRNYKNFPINFQIINNKETPKHL